MILLNKKDINLIEIFPKDEACVQRMQDKKVKWLIEILREKYPDDTIREAIKSIVSTHN